MNPQEERWKYRHGLLLPKEYVEETDDRLEEIILRLPCYEPPNLEIQFRVADILKHLLVVGGILRITVRCLRRRSESGMAL